MGATSVLRTPGITTRQFFERMWDPASESRGDARPRFEIIADGAAPESGAEWSSVYYAAVKDHATGQVTPFIALMASKGSWYTYKDFAETSGSGLHDAPASVLDALSPTTNPEALRWRAECRRTLAEAPDPVRPGDTIVLTSPIRFADGVSTDRLTFVSRYTFRRRGDGVAVRLPRDWKARWGYRHAA